MRLQSRRYHRNDLSMAAFILSVCFCPLFRVLVCLVFLISGYLLWYHRVRSVVLDKSTEMLIIQLQRGSPIHCIKCYDSS